MTLTGYERRKSCLPRLKGSPMLLMDTGAFRQPLRAMQAISFALAARAARMKALCQSLCSPAFSPKRYMSWQVVGLRGTAPARADRRGTASHGRGTRNAQDS